MVVMDERERIIEACQRLAGLTPIGWQLDTLMALAAHEPRLVYVPGGRQAGRTSLLKMATALEHAGELKAPLPAGGEPASPVEDQSARAAAAYDTWYDSVVSDEEAAKISAIISEQINRSLARKFEDATQCKATTFESRRCARRRVLGSDYCRQHATRRPKPEPQEKRDPFLLPCVDKAHMHLTDDRRLRGFTVKHCPGEGPVTPASCGVTFVGERA